MLQRMRALPPEVLDSYDVGSIRAVSVGSAPTPWALKEWVMDYFGPVLHEGYGASEVGMVAVMRPDGAPGAARFLRPAAAARRGRGSWRRTARSCPGARTASSTSAPRSPSTGYLDEHEREHDRITPDGFFRSGDIGRLTAETTSTSPAGPRT